MNLKRHANRYYKSLCTCQYPAPSKFARDLCAWCGGIVPRHRLLRFETSSAGARRELLFIVFVIAVIMALGLLFPGALDRAFYQIGR